MNFIVGSATTHMRRNPGFSVVSFDYDTLLPMNIETYYMDIVEANANDSPNWKLLHDYINTYQLHDMSPSSMLALSQKIFTDQQTALIYGKYRSKLGPGQYQ